MKPPPAENIELIREESFFRTRTFRIGAPILGVLAIAAAFAAPHAKHRFDRWSASRHVRRAAAEIARHDWQHALLDAQNALRLNRLDPEAHRVLAQTLEGLRAPEAVRCRKQLDAMRPGDPENVLALATDEIAAGDFVPAEQELATLKPADRNTARYHEDEARIAFKHGNPHEAEWHFAEAARLEPNEDRHRLAFASLRLHSTTPAIRAAALDMLAELSARSATGIRARRLLLEDALNHKDAARARQLADALVAEPGATFADKLARLQTLLLFKDHAATEYLNELRATALSKPADLTKLLALMNGNGLAPLVSEWVPALPPAIVSKPPVCIAIADARLMNSEWRSVKAMTENANWLGADYLRLSVPRASVGGPTRCHTRKRGVEGRGGRKRERTRCAATDGSAGGRGSGLGLAAKAEAVRWKMADRDGCPRKTLSALRATALQRGDTAQALKAGKHLLSANPKDPAIRTSQVFLSLLTRTESANPHEVAEALSKEMPGDPTVAAIRGLSLYQQGRRDEAVAVMRTLTPAQLHEPGIALYHGIFLLAAKQGAEAKPYLDIGAKRPLLPEEKALLTKVTADYQSEIFPFQKPAPKPAETWLNSPELRKQLPR